MKIHAVWADLFHADERMDGHKHYEANSRFSQFCKYTSKLAKIKIGAPRLFLYMCVLLRVPCRLQRVCRAVCSG